MDRSIKFGFIAVTMSTILAGAITWATAQENEGMLAQSAVGLICDTAEQVEQVVQETKHAPDLADAIETVNADAGNPQACGIAMIRFIADQEVERMGTFRIQRILVTGFNDGEKWLPIEPPQIQFTVLDPNGQDV